MLETKESFANFYKQNIKTINIVTTIMLVLSFCYFSLYSAIKLINLMPYMSLGSTISTLNSNYLIWYLILLYGLIFWALFSLFSKIAYGIASRSFITSIIKENKIILTGNKAYGYIANLPKMPIEFNDYFIGLKLAFFVINIISGSLNFILIYNPIFASFGSLIFRLASKLICLPIFIFIFVKKFGSSENYATLTNAFLTPVLLALILA